MEYTLMHRDVDVADIRIDERSGTIAHDRAVAISSFISSRVDSLRRMAEGSK